MGMLVVTFFAMLLIVAAMSIGVLFGRKPISGSCGGVGAALGEEDYVCDLCGNDESKCKEINADETDAPGANRSSTAQADLAYNAGKASEDKTQP